MSKAIEILNDIDKSHGLKELISKGLFSWKLLFYRDIYNEYDAYLRMGFRKEESIRLVQDKLNICRSTVYNALKSMRNE